MDIFNFRQILMSHKTTREETLVDSIMWWVLPPYAPYHTGWNNAPDSGTQTPMPPQHVLAVCIMATAPVAVLDLSGDELCPVQAGNTQHSWVQDVEVHLLKKKVKNSSRFSALFCKLIRECWCIYVSWTSEWWPDFLGPILLTWININPPVDI